MKIKKIRNIILVTVVFFVSAFLVHGIFSIAGVFYANKAYMHEPSGADITIVDFNQYGCDLCRIIHPTLIEAMAKDGKVRYIPRIVLSDSDFDSTIVHAVYAAASQGKFIQMHNAVYNSWPVETLGELMSIAEQLGLDTAQLRSDMDSKKVKQKIQESEDYFAAWKLPGVPAFFIDKKIRYMPNRSEMPTVDTWLEKFERVRNL